MILKEKNNDLPYAPRLNKESLKRVMKIEKIRWKFKNFLIEIIKETHSVNSRRRNGTPAKLEYKFIRPKFIFKQSFSSVEYKLFIR